jgi:hypothetical protein
MRPSVARVASVAGRVGEAGERKRLRPGGVFCMKRTPRPRHHSKLREMTIVSCRMPDYDCMDQYPALVGTGPINGVRQLGEATPEDVVPAVLLRLIWARLKRQVGPSGASGGRKVDPYTPLLAPCASGTPGAQGAHHGRPKEGMTMAEGSEVTSLG